MGKKGSKENKIKYSKEDIKITTTLIMCLVTVMVCSLSLISIYEEKSLLDIIQDVATEAESMINGEETELIKLQEEAVPAAGKPSKQPILNATKNNYDMGNLYTDGMYRFYYKGKKLKSKMGIDVSYYQGKIDWKKVKASGIDFAIIRLGYRGYMKGELQLDSCYKYNMEQATKVGVDVGVYFFTQALTVKEAKEEALYCVKYVKKYDLKYPIVIDTEAIDDNDARSHATELSKQELTNICKAFCDTVNKAGYESAIYASKSWFLQNLDLEQLNGYNKWLAHYTKVTDYMYDYDMWQYTSDGKVDGIKGRVDLNIGF